MYIYKHEIDWDTYYESYKKGIIELSDLNKLKIEKERWKALFLKNEFFL